MRVDFHHYETEELLTSLALPAIRREGEQVLIKGQPPLYVAAVSWALPHLVVRILLTDRIPGTTRRRRLER